MYTSHGYEFIAAVVVIIIITYFSKYLELSRSVPKSVSKSVVAIFLGPHSQLKTAVSRSFAARCGAGCKSFIFISSNELFDRLSKKLFPGDFGCKGPDFGDKIFHALTYIRRADGAMDLNFTEKGKGFVGALHESWMSFLSSGQNLVIDYTVSDEWSVHDFFAKMRRAMAKDLDRVMVFELRMPTADSGEDKTEWPFPKGFNLSSYRCSRDLRCVPSAFNRVQIEVSENQNPDDIAGKAYMVLLRSGLL